MNDRSNEALLARRAIAEKSTPYGPVLLPPSPCEDSWHVRNDSDTKVIRCYGFGNNGTGEAARHLALYIAATPPETVIADIDEILRLRNELAATECREGEGDAYVEQLCLERDDLEGQVERLEREADWLAAHCASYVDKADMAKWREAARKAVEKNA